MGTLELSNMVHRNLNFNIEKIVIDELRKHGINAMLNVERLRWVKQQHTGNRELQLDGVTLITFYKPRFTNNVDGLVTYSFDYKVHA